MQKVRVVLKQVYIKISIFCVQNAGRKGGGKCGKDMEIASGPPSPRASSSASSTVSIFDDNHWSKDDKYDAESYLEINYKKHLTRHANK